MLLRRACGGVRAVARPRRRRPRLPLPTQRGAAPPAAGEYRRARAHTTECACTLAHTNARRWMRTRVCQHAHAAKGAHQNDPVSVHASERACAFAYTQADTYA
eukprot:6204217-Pleurochrysis_carterae.AAC.1